MGKQSIQRELHDARMLVMMDLKKGNVRQTLPMARYMQYLEFFSFSAISHVPGSSV